MSETSHVASDIAYGRSNLGISPVSFCQYELEPDVLAYLQSAELFCIPNDPRMLEDAGFESCVDYPNVPKHTYYEGYFHSLPQQSPIPAQHPRMGFIHEKPPAPLRLTSFLEAIRSKNKIWLDMLRQRLESMGSISGKALARVIATGHVFADIAVQVHFGDAISEDISRYHVDAPNSLLHLATSVRGNRTLLWKGSAIQSENPDDYSPKVEQQGPGRVYLSYPVAFSHSVLYPECPFEHRVIAVQARCLLTMEDLECYGSETKKGFQNSISTIYEATANGFTQEASGDRIAFTMPGMEDIMKTEMDLRRFCKDEKSHKCTLS